MSTFSNKDDVIDSRDVIARIDELENAIEHGQDESGDVEELKILKVIATECESYSDWKYGETLIRDSYFTKYMKEMLEDCGTLPKDLPSYIVIDWEDTADNLKADYTSVDFDGAEYWIRCV